MLAVFTLVGMMAGVAFPLLASLIEGFRVSGELSFAAAKSVYLTFPPGPKFVGPIVLGSIGFAFGRQNLIRIREQVKYVERLRVHSEELERRNEALRELNEALDSLVYTASHDLKTPVVNFKGLLNMLRMVKDRPNSEAMVDDIIGRLDTSADRFMTTISDLLDVSRVERQLEQEKERIGIEGLVQDILTDMEEQLRTADARIEIDTTAAEHILMARQALRSLLQNLITNAVKYAHPKRNPLIRVISTIQDGQLRIAVSDNGQGIDLNVHGEKLFRMFSRLHDQKDLGNGVGLYIVKRTMDQAGGQVLVDSQPGQGSTFQLSFPSNCIP